MQVTREKAALTGRSEMMAKVRSRDTKPEMVVRSIAHRLGFRFRLCPRTLPGKPDLVFPRHRKVIFVHGCFWHRHAGCSKASLPKTRVDFWQAKLNRNVERDLETVAQLEAAGWEIMIIWECDTKQPQVVADRILRFFGN